MLARIYPGARVPLYSRTSRVEAVPEADSSAVPEVSDRLIDQIEQAFREQCALPQLIEAGQRDEANWLRRTQWAVYLHGIDPQHLVDSVQASDTESSDPTELGPVISHHFHGSR
jgi:hypothetical protein